MLLNLIAVLSVISVVSDPGRPVLRQNTARFRPRTACDIPTIPFQRPQFLEPDTSRRPVHEKQITESTMPIDAKMVHFARGALIGYSKSIPGQCRLIGMAGPGIIPGRIAENRYCICADWLATTRPGIRYY